MTTSREAFTEAYRQKFGFAPDMATPEEQMLLWAWQACDAHWREKLQSEEMVELMCKTYWGEGRTRPYESVDDAFKAEMQGGMREVVAAISKEMGV